MTASPQLTAVDFAPYRWSVPIGVPAVPPEPAEPAPIPDRCAHEDVFTFVRAAPSDIVRIDAMFRRCSIHSRRRRFFRPVPSVPSGYLEEILADRDTHHVFVVLCNGEMIGLAELHVAGSRSGALALIIEDSYQRRGAGTAALQMLLSRARELGLRMLTADLLFENSVVLGALRRVGPYSMDWEDDVFHVELDLTSAESAEGWKREGQWCAG
jgi:RimJ/RimL family protein N-acetyltransferase